MHLAGFTHRPGTHCGSTALADVLRFQGLDLPEPLVFGLGAGCGFSWHDGDTSLTPPQASRFFVGRSATFEQDLCDVLEAQLTTEVFACGAEAYDRALEHLAQGTPVLAYTNLHGLPYLNARGHWHGHLVVLAGPELVADNEYAELQPVPRGTLQAALGLGAPIRASADCALLTVQLGGRPDLRQACTRALGLQALRMTEDGPLDALRTLPDELRSWEARPDWQRCVRLAAQVIEVRGCGGGLFRRLYGAFLEHVGRFQPECAAAADAWTRLAQALDDARRRDEPQLRDGPPLGAEPQLRAAPPLGAEPQLSAGPQLAEAAARAEAVVRAEETLWQRVLEQR